MLERSYNFEPHYTTKSQNKRTRMLHGNGTHKDGESSRIDSVIENEAEIVRLIQQDVGRLRDTGNGSDIHTIINEDSELREEFDEILQRFHEKDRDESSGENSLKSPFGQHEVVPPENFSHVAGEIYRSSFPRVENFPFLQHRLRLKSILVLIPEAYPPENEQFLKEAGIQLFQVGMSGNKEPFVNIPSDLLTRALEIVLNPDNQPILIHCNRGKHRTGCLIGCIRKLQNWSLTMIFDEYRRFAFPKARALDQQFIEMYDDEEIISTAYSKHWLPIQW